MAVDHFSTLQEEEETKKLLNYRNVIVNNVGVGVITPNGPTCFNEVIGTTSFKCCVIFKYIYQFALLYNVFIVIIQRYEKVYYKLVYAVLSKLTSVQALLFCCFDLDYSRPCQQCQHCIITETELVKFKSYFQSYILGLADVGLLSVLGRPLNVTIGNKTTKTLIIRPISALFVGKKHAATK